jgi:hypothetical protein
MMICAGKLTGLPTRGVAGWIGVGVSSFPGRWMKVLALIIYPFLMMALLFLAVVRHLPIL